MLAVLNSNGKRVLNKLNRIRKYLSGGGAADKNEFKMDACLKRLSKRGIEIGTILDVGASDGRWARLARKSFPNSKILLIEAQALHTANLKKYVSQDPLSDYVICVAGEKAGGEIYFDQTDAFGGVASEKIEGDGNANWVKLPVTSLSHEVKQRSLKGPFLIKLDTHGFEVPILNGANEIWNDTMAIVVEVYNFRLMKDSLKFWEFCTLLEQRGFLPVDMVDPLIRPADGTLWQLDMVFLRKDAIDHTPTYY